MLSGIVKENDTVLRKRISDRLLLIIMITIATFCILTLVPTDCSDAAEVDSGTCGSNLEWSIDDAGKLTITGTGAMDVSAMSPKWGGHTVTSVSLPAGLTTIDSNSFEMTEIEEITIPEGVTTIGNSAFMSCSYLRTVAIPSTVTCIEYYAFYGTAIEDLTYNAVSCEFLSYDDYVLPNTLTNVTLGESVEVIPSYFISECANVASIELPAGVRSIGNMAFKNCTSLTNISVAGSNPYYAVVDGVLFNEGLTELVAYPAGDTRTDYPVPDDVSVIRPWAFSGCGSLTEVNLNDSLTAISDGAFYGCTGLSSITIPRSVNTLGDSAFGNCSSMTTVYFNAESNVTYTGYESLFSDSVSLLVIGDSVQTVPYLGYSVNFERIYIGSGAREFTDYSGTVTDRAPFEGFRRLSVIEVSPSNAYFVSVNDVLFNKDGTRLIQYPSARGATGYEIPDSVQSIAQGAFVNCINLQNVTIPESIESFTANTFIRCNNLTGIIFNARSVPWTIHPMFFPDSLVEIELGATVEEVQAHAFDNCTHLTRISVDPSNQHFVSVDGILFDKDVKTLIRYPAGKTGTSYPVPAGVETIGQAAFGYCANLESVTLPSSVRLVDALAFYCASLSSVVLSEGLDTIGYMAFAGSGVTSVEIPNSVETLGAGAFQSCPSLATIFIGAGVKTIQYYYQTDFVSGSSSLSSIEVSSSNPEFKSIDGVLFTKDGTELIRFPEGKPATSYIIPNGVTYVNVAAFRDNTLIVSVTMPDSLVNLGGYGVFNGCTSLESIVIGSGVIGIPESCFYGCTSLTSVTIGERVETIGNSAFGECTSLTSVTNRSLLPITANSSDFGGVAQYATSVTGNVTHVDIDGLALLINDLTGKGKVIDYSGNANVLTLDTVEVDSVEYSLFSIGEEAFSGNQNLVVLVLGDSVEAIGYNAFSGCSNLTSVSLGASVTRINPYSFEHCPKIYEIEDLCPLDIVVGDPDNGYVAFYAEYVHTSEGHLTTVVTGDGLVYGTYDGTPCLLGYVGQESSFVFPETIDGSRYSMRDSVFRNNSTITNVTIRGVDTISYAAFCGSTVITSLTIGDDVKHIENEAFSDCSLLTTVVLGSGIRTIGGSFYHCSSLTDVTNRSLIRIDPGSLAGGGVAYYATSVNGELVDGTSDNGFEITYNNLSMVCSVRQIASGGDVDLDGISVDSVPCTVLEINSGAAANNEELTSIVIPDTVRYLGDYAFYGCTALRTVTLGGGLEDIYMMTFANCTSLTNIIIPEGVTRIWGQAFSDCTSLASVTLPDTLEGIDAAAFIGCSSLTEISIPGSVTEILGDSPFEGCISLTDIDVADSNLAYMSIEGVLFSRDGTVLLCYPAGRAATSYDVPDDVTVILPSAFRYCNALAVITLHEGLEEIGNYAFSDCDSLTAIVLPPGMETIRSGAFYGCDSLSTVTIQEGARTIGDGAFGSCVSLREVHIPSTVSEIGDLVFSDCTSLSLIDVADTNTNYRSYGNVLFDEPLTTIIQYPVGSNNPIYEVPGTVRTIGDNAFKGATHLISVITNMGLAEIRDGAFYDCINLFEVINRSDLDIVKGSYEHGYIAYYATNLFDSSQDATVGVTDDGFVYGSTEGTVYLMGHIRSAADLILPDDIGGSPYNIYRDAFRNRTDFTSLYVAPGVADIGEGAFSGCTSLVSVVFDATSCCDFGQNNPPFPSTVSSVAFGAHVRHIPGALFYGNERLTTVTIPEGVTSFGDQVFGECNSMTSVTFNARACTYAPTGASIFPSSVSALTIGNDVSAIPGYLFTGLTGLTSLVIPDSVTTIGDFAFSGCTSVRTLSIGSGVASFGTYPFNGLSSLTTLNYNAASCSDALGVFSQCPITEAAFGSSVQVVPDYVLQYCSTLLTVTLGPNVRTIGGMAFYGCTSLTEITIPPSMVSSGSPVFYGCTNLETVYFDAVSFEDGLFPFCQCPATTLIFGDTVEKVPSGLLSQCDTQVITIGPNVKTINAVFYNEFGNLQTVNYNAVSCAGLDYGMFSSNLAEINIGEGVRVIPAHMFDNTAIRTITIPESVTTLDPSAFYNCTSLETVRFNAVSCEDMGYGPFPDSVTAVTIGEAVERIPDYLFERLGAVETISIPERVTEIGDYAFYGCASLNAIVIPNGVTSLGEYAFYGCSGADSLDIGEGVTAIGDYAFFGCSSISNVTIPNAVSSLGKEAFEGCSGLVSVHFNAVSCTDITNTNHVFSNSVTSIDFGDSVTSVPANVMYGASNLSSLTLGSSITSIGKRAFSGCSNLESVMIPANVTSIGDSAFSGCSKLGYPQIPSGVTALSDGVFSGCRSFVSVTVPATVSSVGERAFSGCTGMTQISISDGVRTIGEHAFSGCTSLSMVTIPESITTIGNEAFARCDTLTRVDFNAVSCGGLSFGEKMFPASVTAINFGESTRTIPAGLLSDNDAITEVTIPQSVTAIGILVFAGCSSLTTLNYNAVSCSDMSEYGSFGSSLTTVNIGSSVERLPAKMLNNCTSIESITLPASVTSMDRSFLPAAGLTTLIYDARSCELTGNGYYNFPQSLINLTIGHSVRTIAPDLFRGGSFSNLIMEEGVTEIGVGAFSNCASVASVSIPNSVLTIGANAFDSCSAITTLTIGEGVETIGSFAFSNTTNLERLFFNAIACADFDGQSEFVPRNVVFGDKVQRIPAYMLAENTYLTSIDLPGSMRSIGEKAFYGCTGLRAITIPSGVTSLEKHAFYLCTKLTSIEFNAINCADIPDDRAVFSSPLKSVTIGDSVRVPANVFRNIASLETVDFGGAVAIGSCAFRDCTSLRGVDLSDSVVSIGTNAFNGCELVDRANIPTEVTELGQGAFIGTNVDVLNYDARACTNMPYADTVFPASLHKIVLGGSVTSLPENLFTLGSLTEIEVEGTNVHYSSLNGILYDVDKNTLVAYPIGKDASSFRPDVNFQRISAGAFRGCEALRVIILPDALTEISICAFEGCSFLSRITFGTHLETIGDGAFIRDFVNSKGDILSAESMRGRTFVLDGEVYLSITAIVFESNKGSPMNDLSGIAGKSISSVPDPTRTGYDFEGWYADSELTNLFVFDTYPDEDTTVYAKWAAKDYTIRYLDDNGAVLDEKTGTYDQAVPMTEVVPSKPSDSKFDYSFDSWRGYVQGMLVDGARDFVAFYLKTVKVEKDEAGTYSIDIDDSNASFTEEKMAEIKEHAVADPSVTMKVTVSSGTVVFDNTALQNLSAEGSTLEIVEKSKDTMSAENREFVGDNPVISITFGNNTQFGGGTATVTIPYVLPEGKDPSDVHVYYIADGREPEAMPCEYNGDGTVTFTTTHFSDYVVKYVESGSDKGSFPIMYVVIAIVGAVAVLGAGLFVWKRKTA